MRSLSLASVVGGLIFFASAAFVLAYDPVIIKTPDQNEVLPIQEPAISHVYYGELAGYPHMYEFYTKEPMTLSVEVLVPDARGVDKNISGIILAVQKNGSVKEVARLRAREASWESFYEWWGGDRYLRGGSYEGAIEKGNYRIEVSTPENFGKYALSVGTKKDFPGYFATLSDIIAVKQFFGKTAFSAIFSPFFFGPILLVTCVALGVLWRFGLLEIFWKRYTKR